ncbi:MAG: hypothetical protein HY722_16275 [Planctomycetes bacterium]|nr:hypothetical protein [Planctomycetota bacterium]
MRPRGFALLALALALGPLAHAGRDDSPIPYDHIGDPRRSRQVRRVVSRPTVWAPTRHEQVRSDLETYDYLLDRLDLTAAILRALGTDDYDIQREDGGAYRIDDLDGAMARMSLVYREREKRVYYGRGKIEGDLLPAVTGSGVILVEFHPEEDGLLDTSAHIWFRADLVPLHLLARPLAPLLHGQIERRIERFIDAAKTVTERVHADPAAVYRRLRDSDEVSPEAVATFRERFLEAPARTGAF